MTIVCHTQYNENNNNGDFGVERMKQETVLNNIVQEMRRGTLTLSVLSQLEEPQYGYSLLKRLADKGVTIEQNTLYPLLRRLEEQGLLDSDWSLEESRPRRYYVLSSKGRQVVQRLLIHWEELVRTVDRVLEEYGGD